MKEEKEPAKMQSEEAIENNETSMLNSDENLNEVESKNEEQSNLAEIELLKIQVAEAQDKLLRKIAEFDNFKKRNSKERIELIQTAGREVIIDMLSVLDDCERATKQMSSTDDPTHIKEGVNLVFNKLKNTLLAKGLKPMETINQLFNSDMHEAITEIEAPTEALKGKVVDEIEKGYYLNEKIIRYAKVIIGK